MKRGSVLRSLAVGLGVAACTLSASATDLTLTADAHVNAARPTSNFGSIANLYVGNGNTALLDFDLNSLPAGVTASQISHATLTLFINRVNAAGAVSVAPVTSAWAESGVTYATLPSIGSTTNTFTASLAGQYVTLDVTALVQGWVNNPVSNNGVALSSAAANILLDSKENDQTAHPARLDVTITSMGAVGPTGSQGPQGIQGLPGLAGAQGLQGIAGPQGVQGLAGLAGAQGATGVQGVQGATGAVGAQGATGQQGPQGPTGATGQQGLQGVTGATGATGQQGVAGMAGATGATGNTVGGAYNVAVTYFPGSVVIYSGQTYLSLTTDQGITPGTDPTVWSLISTSGSVGATGATGATGAQGPQGPQGPQGVTGAQGQQGVQGAMGATGATGQQGVTGATGATGMAGATGAAGVTGPTGATGVAGATGQQGVAGVTGAVGATGATGQQGAQGATGTTGAAGSTGITYMGTYSAGATYAGTSVVLYNSSLYINTYAGTTPAGTPPTNTTYWSLLLPQGATGATGMQGAAGLNGSTGATGATGPAGVGGSAQASAWNGSTAYVAGQLVTYSGELFLAQQSSANVQPGTIAGAAYWSPFVSSTAVVPLGIPYATSTHYFGSSAEYVHLTDSVTTASAGAYTEALPIFASSSAPCTPTISIYNPTSLTFTFYLYPITYTGLTGTLGSAILSVTVNPNGTTSATATPITSTQFLMGSTSALPSGTANSVYGLAFSCQ